MDLSQAFNVVLDVPTLDVNGIRTIIEKSGGGPGLMCDATHRRSFPEGECRHGCKGGDV